MSINRIWWRELIVYLLWSTLRAIRVTASIDTWKTAVSEVNFQWLVVKDLHDLAMKRSSHMEIPNETLRMIQQ